MEKPKVPIVEKYNQYRGDLSHPNTDELAKDLCELILYCDKAHHKFLDTEGREHDEVPNEAIALITRMSAELTSRYLLTSF